MLLLFLFGITAESSLENFLNRWQDFAYEIDVSIKGKKPKSFHGLFYWYKDACKTACALAYDKEVGHRSLIVRDGKKTYHYVVYADPRNKTTKTNISNSPLHAFFAPLVRLKADERFTKTLTKICDGHYVMEIRHFTDTKKQKEHAKIYFKREHENWIFEKWAIVRCDGVTEILFTKPVSLAPALKKSFLNSNNDRTF
jgi:hypothetical protein